MATKPYAALASGGADSFYDGGGKGGRPVPVLTNGGSGSTPNRGKGSAAPAATGDLGTTSGTPGPGIATMWNRTIGRTAHRPTTKAGANRFGGNGVSGGRSGRSSTTNGRCSGPTRAKRDGGTVSGRATTTTSAETRWTMGLVPAQRSRRCHAAVVGRTTSGLKRTTGVEDATGNGGDLSFRASTGAGRFWSAKAYGRSAYSYRHGPRGRRGYSLTRHPTARQSKAEKSGRATARHQAGTAAARRGD